MNIAKTKISGIYEIENRQFSDNRELFVKTFHAKTFKQYGLNDDFKESFYSVSQKGVLRGMHFQLPPRDHDKLVYVVQGEILDVALDIRSGSDTYGEYYSTTISSQNCRCLYLAKGIAHGFLTLSETATVIYSTTTEYSHSHDTGIRWDSFGFEWPKMDYIISDRDLNFEKFLR